MGELKTHMTKAVTNTQLSEPEILEKFSQIVGKSLRVDPALVTAEAYLEDLGAESLDLIEITMETESQFDIWLPEKSILDVAAEVFGAGSLEKDGYLTAEGKRLMACRMPDADAAAFTGEVAVHDLRHYFLKVGTWTRMIGSLLQHTPRVCSKCGGALQASIGLRMKCEKCAAEVSLRSGEEINREWVKQYYEKEYGAIQDRAAGQALAASAGAHSGAEPA
jgi:acyl carrier protein